MYQYAWHTYVRTHVQVCSYRYAFVCTSMLDTHMYVRTYKCAHTGTHAVYRPITRISWICKHTQLILVMGIRTDSQTNLAYQYDAEHQCLCVAILPPFLLIPYLQENTGCTVLSTFYWRLKCLVWKVLTIGLLKVLVLLVRTWAQSNTVPYCVVRYCILSLYVTK